MHTVKKAFRIIRRRLGNSRIQTLGPFSQRLAMGCLVTATVAGCGDADVSPSNALDTQAQQASELPSNNSQAFNVIGDVSDDFTIEGKPTKTRETLNGTFSVYDIENDPSIKKAIESLYERGDITFGDITNFALDYTDEIWTLPEVKYLRAAYAANYSDLKRLGCRNVQQKVCRGGPQLSYFGPEGINYLGNAGFLKDELKYVVGGESLAKVGKTIRKNEVRKGRWLDSQLFAELKPTNIGGQYHLAYGYYTVGGTCNNPANSNVPSMYFFGKGFEYSALKVEEIYKSNSCKTWVKFP